ncbi:mutator protein [Hordeum vulgare]|nr:mutator protein [Hordeum vulgare]
MLDELPDVMPSVEAVAELAFRCVAPNKDDRPNAREALAELRRIQGMLYRVRIQGRLSPSPIHDHKQRKGMVALSNLLEKKLYYQVYVRLVNHVPYPPAAPRQIHHVESMAASASATAMTTAASAVPWPNTLQRSIGDLTDARMVWLLNNVYDVEHRAYFMSEKKMELTPLKIRSHGASSGPGVEDGGKKDRVPAGAPFTWIAANFAHCPEDADGEVIQRYARVYMWYVISRTIFADGTGKNAPWMWLKALTVFDNKFSWGSAALAYLYRQLDDACRMTTKDGGVGDCMLLLSVWSWERLPVGRPKSSQWNTWDDHGNPVRQPTWAYKWDLVSEVASKVNLLYKQYTNEMDSLTPEQVEWEPYGVGPNFGDAHTFELNPLCMQERHLWLMRCPLICNWAVEFHLPHRMMHQFGFFQPHPPEWVDTDTQLHSVQAASSIRRTQYHQHCPLAFNNYVRWFQESTRVEICPPAYEEDILEEPTEYDALAQGRYNKLIREGYQTSFAPVLNFVRKEVKKQADESEDILDNTPGGKKGESVLRLFIKEQGQKLRRLSNILGCRDPEYVSPSRSGSSERNTLHDSASSGARMDDGDITSIANTQRNTVEDDVDTPEVADGMTLKAFQRSAYMLKPRKEFRRYSPDDYAEGKNPVAGGSHLSRMRSMDDEDEDDDDDESDDTEQFVVARRKKLVSKRGRGPKM